MARRLKTHVHLSIDGALRSYGPGDDVPDDIAERIANPDAWEADADIRPARSDSKAMWIDYAVTQGASHIDVAAMTKDDLLAAYGG